MEASMRGWRMKVGPVMMASVLCSTPLAAQAGAPAKGGPGSDICSLVTSEEFQRAHGVNPQIGILPDEPVATQMVWGWHCDYADGSIDLFQTKSPSAELDRVLGLGKAPKTRTPVQGLGSRAFFTVIYPDDKYRRRGFLAIDLGPRILTLSMDPRTDEEALEATRPRLEELAKLVLPRVK
jgi:hypothetical protein